MLHSFSLLFCFRYRAAFGTPEALGAHIVAMDANETLYQSYFAWRAEGWKEFRRSALWTRAKPPGLKCELCERVHHVRAGCALESGK
jgi:Glycosyltransferase family 10 (fucosyltransferase) C-term